MKYRILSYGSLYRVQMNFGDGRWCDYREKVNGELRTVGFDSFEKAKEVACGQRKEQSNGK